ncbi:hypothetical protein DA097_10755 [Vibrio rotiferianus]|nr:hypothetical protein DA097_10755 [Vibrio rotiferianus]
MIEIPNISLLAKATQTHIGLCAYARVVNGLSRNGFSEIGLYSAVVNKCSQIGKDPSVQFKDMAEILQGCAKEADFPSYYTKFGYLDDACLIRHSPHSPEQMGMFLCRKCRLVKSPSERPKKSKLKNTCHLCVNSTASSLTNRSLTSDRRSKIRDH